MFYSLSRSHCIIFQCYLGTASSLRILYNVQLIHFKINGSRFLTIQNFQLQKFLLLITRNSLYAAVDVYLYDVYHVYILVS